MLLSRSREKDQETLSTLYRDLRQAEERMVFWRTVALNWSEELVPVLRKVFSFDLERQDSWLFAKNPAFHNLTPADMIMIGRTSEVVQFLTNAAFDDQELFKG